MLCVEVVRSTFGRFRRDCGADVTMDLQQPDIRGLRPDRANRAGPVLAIIEGPSRLDAE
jgi:hypothetical protein